MYGLFIFFDDETATLSETPSAIVDTIPTEITPDLLREIFVSVDCGGMKEYNITEEDVKSWSAEKTGQAFWDVHCIMVDSVAVIHESNFDKLSAVGEKLISQFGTDSSTYHACDTFNSLLKKRAEIVLPMPCGDSDEYFTDMSQMLDKSQLMWYNGYIN